MVTHCLHISNWTNSNVQHHTHTCNMCFNIFHVHVYRKYYDIGDQGSTDVFSCETRSFVAIGDAAGTRSRTTNVRQNWNQCNIEWEEHLGTLLSSQYTRPLPTIPAICKCAAKFDNLTLGLLSCRSSLNELMNLYYMIRLMPKDINIFNY